MLLKWNLSCGEITNKQIIKKYGLFEYQCVSMKVLIGHFRVAPSLCFSVRLLAKPNIIISKQFLIALTHFKSDFL